MFGSCFRTLADMNVSGIFFPPSFSSLDSPHFHNNLFSLSLSPPQGDLFPKWPHQRAAADGEDVGPWGRESPFPCCHGPQLVGARGPFQGDQPGEAGGSKPGQQDRHADGSPLHAVTQGLLSRTVYLKNATAGRNRKVPGAHLSMHCPRSFSAGQFIWKT